MRGECDETYYQEAKGRTSWDPTSKQCLKSSSITIAGSQGSPMRSQCLLGSGTACIPFILSSSRSAFLGPLMLWQTRGMPMESKTDELFWVSTICWASLLLHAWSCSYASYRILEAIQSSGEKPRFWHQIAWVHILLLPLALPGRAPRQGSYRNLLLRFLMLKRACGKGAWRIKREIRRHGRFGHEVWHVGQLEEDAKLADTETPWLSKSPPQGLGVKGPGGKCSHKPLSDLTRETLAHWPCLNPESSELECGPPASPSLGSRQGSSCSGMANWWASPLRGSWDVHKKLMLDTTMSTTTAGISSGLAVFQAFHKAVYVHYFTWLLSKSHGDSLSYSLWPFIGEINNVWWGLALIIKNWHPTWTSLSKRQIYYKDNRLSHQNPQQNCGGTSRVATSQDSDALRYFTLAQLYTLVSGRWLHSSLSA